MLSFFKDFFIIKIPIPKFVITTTKEVITAIISFGFSRSLYNHNIEAVKINPAKQKITENGENILASFNLFIFLIVFLFISNSFNGQVKIVKSAKETKESHNKREDELRIEFGIEPDSDKQKNKYCGG